MNSFDFFPTFQNGVKEQEADLLCLLPNSITVLLRAVPDMTMKDIKTMIWQKAEEQPLYSQLKFKSACALVYVNVTGEQEEIEDESVRLGDVNPFAGFIKVIEKATNAQQRNMDSSISALIGKGLHEFDQIDSEEVQEFRVMYRKKSEKFLRDRSVQTMGLEEKICAVYPPDFYTDNPADDLHEDLKTKLFEEQMVLFVFADQVNERNVNISFHLPYNAKAADLVKPALAKLKMCGKKFRSDRPEDYIVKVCGREEYLIGDRGEMKLFHYRYINNHILQMQNPSLVLVDIDVIIDELPKPMPPPRPTRPSRQHLPNQAIPLKRCISLLGVEKGFTIYVNDIRKLNMTNGCKVALDFAIYHGNVCIETKRTRDTEVYDNTALIHAELCFDTLVSNLPRMSRICCQVLQTFGPEGNVRRPRSRRRANQDPVPIAWVNTTVFDYKDVLISGIRRLTVWPYTIENATGFNYLGTVVNNPSRNTAIIEVNFDTSNGQEITYPRFDIMLEMAAQYREEVSLSADDLLRVTDLLLTHSSVLNYEEDDRMLIWSAREEIMHRHPDCLPQLLFCVNWSSYKDVALTHSLLQIWPKDKIPSSVAIELLDFMYADKMVRDFALTCLKSELRDAELNLYLLQLVQAIKYESYLDCPLVEFLISRALHNPRLGHNFFWLLRSEMHNVEVSLRFGLVLEAYCRGAPQQMPSLQKQLAVMIKLQSINSLVKMPKYADKKELALVDMRKVLHEIKDSVSSFVSPLDPRAKVGQIRFGDCKFMDSKMKPLWLHWKNCDASGPDLALLFKNGDDLRQDMLTLQMIHIMDGIWKNHGMDLRMTAYGCVSMGHMVGMIEGVQKSCTIANIQKSYSKALTSAFNKAALYLWLKERNSDLTLQKAIENFTLSCAGYCVATYVLGVGDRHSDNIMIKETGELLHIDFGHFLGNFKSKFGVKRERVPFVLVPDFVYIIKKGTTGEDDNWKRFNELCERAFMAIRKSGKLFINLFMLMLSTGIPELSSVKDIGYLRDTLRLDLSDQGALKHFRSKLTEALKDSWSTRLNWTAHNAAKDNT